MKNVLNQQIFLFFSNLMSSLNKAKFKCPTPILNKKNQPITSFKGKNLMIVSFLEGKAKKNLSPDNCKTIGIEVARMHELTKNFKLKRKNDLSVDHGGLFDSVRDNCTEIHKDLPKLIEENLSDVEKNWPKNLPKGIIHADLFHDNIFLSKMNLVDLLIFTFL